MRTRDVIALLIPVLAACGGSSPVTPPPAATVASVEVTPSTASPVQGTTVQLTGVARAANGTSVSGKVLAWTSSNNAVASVSNGGLVSATAPGSATISATVDGKSGSALVTVQLIPVASVTVTASASSVLAGVAVQLSATAKDALGNTLAGRSATFSSSNTAAATVDAAGLVTTLLPGPVTLTATVEGIAGTVAITIVNPRVIPVLDRPFTGEYPTGNFVDHSVPKEFVDANGVFVTWWGESHAGSGRMVDGHSGYDWNMPIGTPIRAAAPGRVVQATFVIGFCPPLNANVNQGSILIEHTIPGGVVIRTRYEHVSQIDVAVGQIVTAGTQVALSGNTGCTSAPHLHFEVQRLTQTKTGQSTVIDPFGWTGAGTDPWESASDGAASIQLWKANQAPALWREVRLNPPQNPGAAVLVSRVVFEGVNDADTPNNEYVELTLDTRVAQSVSLGGYVLQGDASGVSYPLPASVTLTAAQPTVTVHSGSGTATASQLYMGQPSGIWSNAGADCVRLVNPQGTQLRVAMGGACQ